MTSRLTKRAVAQILMLVQDKLHRLMTNVTKDEYDAELLRQALEHSQTKAVVQKHITDDNIRFMGQNNQQVFRAQMGLIGDKGYRAADESPDAKAQRAY